MFLLMQAWTCRSLSVSWQNMARRLQSASDKCLILLRSSFRVQFEKSELPDCNAPEINHSGMVFRAPAAVVGIRFLLICENGFVQLFTSLGDFFFFCPLFLTVRRR